MLINNAASQRRLFGILCALSIMLVSMPVANGTPGNEEANGDATFEKVWIDHDVRVDGKKGMRIHASFTVKHSFNVLCSMTANFYTKDGTNLPANKPGPYGTMDGVVVAFVKFTPRYTSSKYADKSLFIPYEAFNIRQSGIYELKFMLFLRRHAQSVPLLARSAFVDFTYTKS